MDAQQTVDLMRLLQLYRDAMDAICMMTAEGPSYRTHNGIPMLMPKHTARLVKAALKMDGRDVLPF